MRLRRPLRSEAGLSADIDAGPSKTVPRAPGGNVGSGGFSTGGGGPGGSGGGSIGATNQDSAPGKRVPTDSRTASLVDHVQ